MDQNKVMWVHNNVAGYLDFATDYWLYKYAQLVPENGVIVDIGTMNGRSSCIMATASKPSVQVYTCDITVPANLNTYIDYLGLKDKLHFIHQPSEVLGVTWDKPIDLWFEDCWHEYPRMKASLDIWLPKIKSGSYMIWHDYHLYGGKPEPNLATAIDERVGKDYKKLHEEFNIFIGQKL